ncbi:MAG: copper chaperone PCu(A)C [Actinomycetota bacterium]
MTRRNPAAVAGFATAVALGVAACGGAGADTAAGDELVVSDAWIRPTPPITNVGAFYLTIRNGADVSDRLLAASSPRCAEIELHQTTTVDGVASMSLAGVEELTVAVGAELVFEPNGLHVMCLGLDEPVVEGEEVPLTVEFETSGSRTVQAAAENR